MANRARVRTVSTMLCRLSQLRCAPSLAWTSSPDVAAFLLTERKYDVPWERRDKKMKG